MHLINDLKIAFDQVADGVFQKRNQKKIMPLDSLIIVVYSFEIRCKWRNNLNSTGIDD